MKLPDVPLATRTRLEPFLSSWMRLAGVLQSMCEADLLAVISMEMQTAHPRHDIIDRTVARYNVVRDERELSEMLSNRKTVPTWMSPGLVMKLSDKADLGMLRKNQEKLLGMRDGMDEITTLRLIVLEWSDRAPRLGLLEKLKHHFSVLRKRRELVALYAANPHYTGRSSDA